MEQKYVILGIHGEDVRTVQGNVARVRLFHEGGKDSNSAGVKFDDEDFALPELAPGVVPSFETYEQILKDEILERVEKLEAQDV